MAIQRKHVHNAKASTDESVKKVASKFAKEKQQKYEKKSMALTIVNKNAFKDDSSNKVFQKSKLVSALFNNEDDFKSAIGGEFELSRDHVKQLGSIVNTSQVELKQALLIIYKNKGYKELGCKDFKAYVKKYLTLSYDAALKQVWAAKVAYIVNGLDAIGFFSDNSMLAMKDLSDEQIEDVVEHIEEEYGQEVTINAKYTRKMVEAAIRELGLLDKEDSDEDLEIDDEEVEEDAVEQADDEDLDSDTRPVTKANISTSKQSSKPKQSKVAEIVQSKSHREFLEQFNIKATENKSSKAIFDAFIETDAGNNTKTVTKAIELLCTHLGTIVKSNLSDILKTLETQDE
ncbi:hypothetical protein [Shewanella sp.]|uniref:hypothetical protein n=1 Tax=Shewanella sp. TaxID=50422 RepID=UPI0040549E32